jgi:hypothetical protein
MKAGTELTVLPQIASLVFGSAPEILARSFQCRISIERS